MYKKEKEKEMIRCGSANKLYDDQNLSSMLEYCAAVRKTSTEDIVYKFSSFIQTISYKYDSDSKPCWMNQKIFDLVNPYHRKLSAISESRKPTLNDYGILFVEFSEMLSV